MRHETSIPPNQPKLAWACQFCHDKGLRKTQARDALLRLLVESDAPINWRMLSDTPALKELCDPSTVFRLLVKLEQIGLVRRITVREHAPFFTIGMPGEHNDYVVCTECSSIRSLHIECPGSRLEKQVEERLGFRGLRHEFAFYGVCKECTLKPGMGFRAKVAKVAKTEISEENPRE